jgi:beta-glucosidase
VATKRRMSRWRVIKESKQKAKERKQKVRPQMQAPKFRPKMSVGFETTYIHGTGKDVADITRHTTQYPVDLYLTKKVLNVHEIRYAIPWHKIEVEKGKYDWEWMDRVMELLRALGITIIADPWHHTSHPDWLEDGLANPDAAEYYAAFVLKFAKRYPYIKKYTPFNEPFATTFLAAHEGIWYPKWKKGPEVFIKVAMNVARITCVVSKALRKQVPGVEIIYVDTCEHHKSWAKSHAYELNERRFMILDLALGRGRSNYYLKKFGYPEDLMQWFDDPENQLKIDVLMLDYYSHSEWEYTKKRAYAPSRKPKGFAEVAYDYFKRYRQYGFRFALGETNLIGTVADRLTWFCYMLCEVTKLWRMGVGLEWFTWLPAVDSCSWTHGKFASMMCFRRDFTGLFWLDAQKVVRHESELTESFARVARDEAWAGDLNYYHFTPEVAATIPGHIRLMRKQFGTKGWRKQPPPPKPTTERRGRILTNKVEPQPPSTATA